MMIMWKLLRWRRRWLLLLLLLWKLPSLPAICCLLLYKHVLQGEEKKQKHKRNLTTILLLSNHSCRACVCRLVGSLLLVFDFLVPVFPKPTHNRLSLSHSPFLPAFLEPRNIMGLRNRATNDTNWDTSCLSNT
uniref:Putative secreted peptide n=1 Tax=Anopheles braziliensis TaxID=58242 RepID=A0A2M3ZS68_9DIPT